MAQPPKYERQNEFQTALGTSHGTALDDDFDTVRTSVNATIDNLGLIQRDDGKLANLSVSVDTLNSAVRALIASRGWSIKGAWVTTTSYVVGDVVVEDGLAYVCVTAHTSGTFATDYAAEKWASIGGDFLQDGTGAIVRNVRDKLRETVSVEDFGAVGDGVTDDTAAIQAALSAGGIITFPEGTYIVSDIDADDVCLLISSSTWIVGAGKHLSVIRQTGNSNARDVIKIVEASASIGISGLTIDGNRDGNTGVNSRGISGSRGISNVAIENIELINCAGESLQTNSDDNMHDADDAVTPFAENISIIGVSVRNAGTKAIRVRRTKRVVCRIDNIHVDARVGEDSASGFETANAEDVVCHGANITQDQADRGPGYRLTNNSRNISVVGGTVRGGRQNIFIGNSRNISVIGVVGEDAGEVGISISNTDDDNQGYITTNITIQGCVIINPNGDGCAARINNNGTEVSNVNVFGNTFVGGGSMPFGISSIDNVGGQTLLFREFNNTIIGYETARINGSFKALPSLAAENFWSREVQIADDDFESFPVPDGSVNGIIEVVTNGAASSFSGAASYRAAPTNVITELYNGNPSRLDFTTGPLNGTTGTDTNITVSVDDAGMAYIENRSGNTRRLRVCFRCALT